MTRNRAAAALGRLAACVLLIVPVLATAACGSGVSAGDAAAGAVARLPVVTLPELSAVEPSVRAQLQEGMDGLTRAQQSAGVPSSNLAQAYGDLGKLLLAARFPDHAEACFLNAESLDRDDRRWPYYLGHIYKTRGALESASAAFRRALDLSPRDVPATIWLAELELLKGRPEAAVPLFVTALETNGGRLAARFGLGRAALATRDYAGAVEQLEAALQVEPKASSVHYPLALAYRGLGETAKAERHSRQSGGADIAPADPLMDEVRGLLRTAVSYELVGTRALNAGDWHAALDAFRAGLVLEPSNAALSHKLGTALFLSGDAAGARATFEQVVRTTPAYAKAHYSLGMLLAEEGKSDAAMARLSTALRYEPSYVEARVGLAELLRRRGRLGDAVTEYDRALALDPRLQEAALGRALTLIRLHRYAEAVRRLREARDIHPEAPWLAHALARLLAAVPDDRIRDGQQAVALMESLGQDVQHLDFGETMAMALAEAGRQADAVRWQRAAIELARQAGQSAQTTRMVERLQSYESGRPWRQPWHPEELQ